jgi:hypothetical protein
VKHTRQQSSNRSQSNGPTPDENDFDPQQVSPAETFEDAAWDSFSDDYDGCGSFESGGCPLPAAGGRPCFVRPGKLNSGFAFTFLVPQFGDNIAFTTSQSDGASFDQITPNQFDYGLKAGGRVWLEYICPSDLGLRARYWYFDHAADPLSASPSANGFGRITTPEFGDIDISTTVPGEVMSAGSGLSLNTVDLEGTKGIAFASATLDVSAGVRYGTYKQDYLAQLHGVDGALQGEIDFRHSYDGVGPTLALEARRELLGELSVFSMARGSLLFGYRRSALDGGEDLDLNTPFTTTSTNRRLDTLPIAEMQLGLDWQAMVAPTATLFAQIAMEAQWWQGIGSAATESGDLGLFGFNTAVGMCW